MVLPYFMLFDFITQCFDKIYPTLSFPTLPTPTTSPFCSMDSQQLQFPVQNLHTVQPVRIPALTVEVPAVRVIQLQCFLLLALVNKTFGQPCSKVNHLL